MQAESPAPDNDTMETLIETNELLSKALSLHQRAVLNARKAAGLGTSPTPTPPINQNTNSAPVARTDSGFAAPPSGPPPGQRDQPPLARKQPPIPPPGDYAPTDADEENPFADPSEKKKISNAPPKETAPTSQFAGLEPYHPGFTATESYLGRQDSAVGHVTMQSAVSPEAGRTAGSDRRREERRQADGEVEAQPKAASKPLYRY